MRVDFHGGPEHSTLQSKAGYIDARPQSRQTDENLLQRTAAPYIRGILGAASDSGCPLVTEASSKDVATGVRHLQSLSRRRALPFSSFCVSSAPSGNVFSHSVPGRFSANG